MSPGNQVLKMQMETPLIGSGSQEEVDLRVAAIIDLGKTRGYLTYEELNQKLPDEVVSPDKLDSLLMMIDEMGIRLIDESDVAEFTTKPRKRRTPKLAALTKDANGKGAVVAVDAEEHEEIDRNIEAELAEGSSKRID